MKTLKIFALSLFTSGAMMAQDINPSEVPNAVKSAFQKEYANATDVEWEKKMGNYEVEFDIDRQDHEILYDPSGTVIRKEQDMTENELPQAIRMAITSKYAGYRVDDVDMIWENNSNSYIVELEKNREEIHVTFDSNAKVVNERRD